MFVNRVLYKGREIRPLLWNDGGVGYGSVCESDNIVTVIQRRA